MLTATPNPNRNSTRNSSPCLGYGIWIDTGIGNTNENFLALSSIFGGVWCQ